MEDLSDFTEGPFKLLTECLMAHTKIIIDIEGKGNRRLIAHVISFDHHFNMVLTDVIEKWTETRRGIVEIKERYISKMFLPGHNVKIIVKLAN